MESRSLRRYCAWFCKRQSHKAFFPCVHRPNWNRFLCFPPSRYLTWRLRRFHFPDLPRTSSALSGNNRSGMRLCRRWHRRSRYYDWRSALHGRSDNWTRRERLLRTNIATCGLMADKKAALADGGLNSPRPCAGVLEGFMFIIHLHSL